MKIFIYVLYKSFVGYIVLDDKPIAIIKIWFRYGVSRLVRMKYIRGIESLGAERVGNTLTFVVRRVKEEEAPLLKYL